MDVNLARAASPGLLARRPMTANAQWRLAAFAVLLGLFSLSTLVALGVVGYSPLPLFDAWSPWLDYIGLRPGDYLGYLFRQHNEHRIVYQRLLNSLDLHLAGADARVLLTAAYLGQAASVLLLYHLTTWRRSLPVAHRVTLLGVLAAIGFSAGQWINVLWTFQASFIAVFTFALAAFAAVQRVTPTGGAKPDGAWLLLSVCCAAASTYTMANGLLVWPLLIALAAFQRVPGRAIVVLAVVGTAAVVAYLWGFQSRSPLSGALMKTPEVIVFTCAYLGSAFDEPFVGFAKALGVNPEPVRMLVSAVAGFVGLLLFSRLIRDEMSARAHHTHVRLAMMANVFFIVGSAGLTALGRVQLLMVEALASRYVTPSLLFWAGLCGWMLTSPSTRDERGRWRTVAVAVAAVLGVVAQLPRVTYGVEAAAYLREGEYVMVNRVFDAGVWERFSGNTGSPDRLIPVVEYFRSQRLSTFAQPWTSWLGEALPKHFRIDGRERCTGRWESSTAVGANGSAITEVAGWADEPGPGSALRRVVFADGAGRIAGFAPITRRRPDVAARHPELRGEVVGWTTRLAVASTNPLTAYVLLGDGRSLCPIGSFPH